MQATTHFTEITDVGVCIDDCLQSHSQATCWYKILELLKVTWQGCKRLSVNVVGCELGTKQLLTNFPIVYLLSTDLQVCVQTLQENFFASEALTLAPRLDVPWCQRALSHSRTASKQLISTRAVVCRRVEMYTRAPL